jgi:pilus assembly protein Flp/PilA
MLFLWASYGILKAIICRIRKAPMRKRTNMSSCAEEGGQGLVEYALILVLVAVVVIIILNVLGPAIGNIFSNILYYL